MSTSQPPADRTTLVIRSQHIHRTRSEFNHEDTSEQQYLMRFIAGNPAQPSDNGASRSGLPIPLLVVFSFILGVPFLFIILHLARLLRRNRHPQRDVESTNTIPSDTVDLSSLNDANPSQKYKFKRQETWNSTQTSSAEVCAICLEVLVDEDNIRQLKCKHLFHMSCIDRWFQKHHIDCPLCKATLLPTRGCDPGPTEAR